MTWIINFSTSRINKHRKIPKRPWVIRYKVLLDVELVARDRIKGRNEIQHAVEVEIRSARSI
jgi:hypothetical protein